MEREGPFYPDHGLERIVAYHERQDERFAETAAELSDATRQADPDRHRARRRRSRQRRPSAAVRASGRLCYPSANRAVTALDHLWRYARWRERREPRPRWSASPP